MLTLALVLFVFGIVAGPLINKVVAPPLDLFMLPWALAWGLIGSFVGALAGLSIAGRSFDMHWSALLGAVAGELVVAVGYRLVNGRRSGARSGRTGTYSGENVWDGDSGTGEGGGGGD